MKLFLGFPSVNKKQNNQWVEQILSGYVEQKIKE